MKRFLFALLALVAAPALAQSTTGVYKASPPTLTDGMQQQVLLDANGNIKTATTPPTGASSTQVQGTSAAGATDDGSNPVKIGGVFTTANPSLTNGQRGNLSLNTTGELRVALSASGGSAIGAFATTADGFSTGGVALYTMGYGLVFNGTSWDRARGDANGTAVQPGLGGWTYTSGTTGILSNTTTAVTMKAAAGASIRTFIDSCQIATTAFTTSVPLAIRDGAAGTVIWTVNVPTQGFLTPLTIVFSTPLRSTANTLLEVVTTTANTTGTAMVNCQGHTGI